MSLIKGLADDGVGAIGPDLGPNPRMRIGGLD
jgi:hypothetical protein